MTSPDKGSKHPWKFFRAGGFDQVQISSGADLMALDQLDQKLWVALACPTTGLEFDAKTLAYIDTDNDKRIRAPELIAAAKWAGARLKNPDDLLKEKPTLPLASINDATPEGKALYNSARTILKNLGKPDATEITVTDTADTAKIFEQTAFNGDGIIVAESATDDFTKGVIKDIGTIFGVEKDRSSKPGINQAKVDAFFNDCAAFDAWVKLSEVDASVLPLGEATAAGGAAFRAIKTKVDDYFVRCRLAAFDVRALNALNREEKEYLAAAAKDLTITSTEIASFPLSRIEANKPLPLKGAVNPAWTDAITAFQNKVVTPLLGDKAELTQIEWTGIAAKFTAYETWQSAKKGAAVEPLGIKRVREILASKARDTLTKLIADDKAEEGNVNSIADVDKLIRYHRGLHRLCINFVNFKDFYDGDDPAIFQVGTLYLDQRSCTLCLYVEDAGRHAVMPALAGTYLAYLDCVRKSTGEKVAILAGFTDGDSDNLMVGRNGVFYDRKGRDWDATITKIVDNPISIRQAFWSPYKKLVRMIEEQIAKRAAAAEASANDKLTSAATTVANADKTLATPAKPPEQKKVDVGTVAALGVAFGAIGTAIATITAKLFGLLELPFWQICLAVAGLLLVVSGPSMLIAYLKLRKRNIGPILDANGWAVNARAKINVPFGASLTQVAKLPAGSAIRSDDKFAERPSMWPKLAVVLIVIGFFYSLLNSFGLIHTLTGGFMGTPPASEPAAPSKLSAVAAGATQINLTWKDNSSTENTFVVGRGTTSGGPYTDILTLGANSTSGSDTNLTAGTTYFYVVRAGNKAGDSRNSAPASATTAK